VDFPTLGRPTIPLYSHTLEMEGNVWGGTLRLFPGLPRRSFFSCAAFLGGIFLRRGVVMENERGWDGERRRSRVTARMDTALCSVEMVIDGDRKIFDVEIKIENEEVRDRQIVYESIQSTIHIKNSN
jgi:hypothetical protein